MAGAYEMDDSQLVSSPFALSPAFEPSQEDAAGEEALPMSEAAAAVAAVEASGPVKRKRGRPPKAHGAGRVPVPKKKKEEEEVCFICFDGGDLVLCDRRWVCFVLPSLGALFRVSRFLFFFGLNLARCCRGCPKVYHPACINRDEAFFRSRARWNCGKSTHMLLYSVYYRVVLAGHVVISFLFIDILLYHQKRKMLRAAFCIIFF